MRQQNVMLPPFIVNPPPFVVTLAPFALSRSAFVVSHSPLVVSLSNHEPADRRARMFVTEH